MRNAIMVILVASALGFLGWYYFGPDRQAGVPAIEAQMEAAGEEATVAEEEEKSSAAPIKTAR